LFFQPEQYFSLTTNQPTVFFSRLISTAERLQRIEHPEILQNSYGMEVIPLGNVPKIMDTPLIRAMAEREVKSRARA
jgi:hypothetical protein